MPQIRRSAACCRACRICESGKAKTRDDCSIHTTMNYYTTREVSTDDGMKTLREIFPEAQADELNVVLFSTSGVHGHNLTIEDCETSDTDTVTFLVIKPRIVQVLYGNCRPETPDDFSFLKKLRDSSREILSEY